MLMIDIFPARIQHRPRKMLGFKTAYEVFFYVSVSDTMQPIIVALRT
jgi:IS30 family transposase